MNIENLDVYQAINGGELARLELLKCPLPEPLKTICENQQTWEATALGEDLSIDPMEGCDAQEIIDLIGESAWEEEDEAYWQARLTIDEKDTLQDLLETIEQMQPFYERLVLNLASELLIEAIDKEIPLMDINEETWWERRPMKYWQMTLRDVKQELLELRSPEWEPVLPWAHLLHFLKGWAQDYRKNIPSSMHEPVWVGEVLDKNLTLIETEADKALFPLT